jgi:hypothetical protein
MTPMEFSETRELNINATPLATMHSFIEAFAALSRTVVELSPEVPI